jgi:hypothetical protein
MILRSELGALGVLENGCSGGAGFNFLDEEARKNKSG